MMWIYLMLHDRSAGRSMEIAFLQVHFWNFSQSVCKRARENVGNDDDEATGNLSLIIGTAYHALFLHDHFYNYRMPMFYDKVMSFT